uniref:Holocarboxylase synthetase n=1 Tax=Ananas comosus var. bracteatus TaxID=296719 RepID=A0A6V7QQ76_ANACO
MAKKRKSDAAHLDEVDRTMHSTFCSAANSLSQIFTHAMAQQKLAFQAGERHSMEKLYQWILRHHEEGSRVAVADVASYLQNEINIGGEEVSMSPRSQFPNQHTQSVLHFASATPQNPSSTSGQVTSLSSLAQHSLLPYHLVQFGGYHSTNVLPNGNTSRNNDVNSNDSSMDMHSDGL